MNYSFEYIDIILLAMIAGFIFLRLRGILGKKTGNEENLGATFGHNFSSKPVLLPSIPFNLRKIKPAIIAKSIISIYSKL